MRTTATQTSATGFAVSSARRSATQARLLVCLQLQPLVFWQLHLLALLVLLCRKNRPSLAKKAALGLRSPLTVALLIDALSRHIRGEKAWPIRGAAERVLADGPHQL